MKINILLVEDDPALSLILIDRLEASGYAVDHTENGNIAVDYILTNKYDLIILDVMLKGKNGFDICYDVRTRGVKTPVLMLTARGQLSDKIHGLKIGADDYLTKPFEVIELLARIEALLRRVDYSKPIMENMTIGNLDIDFQGVEVKKNGEIVELSLKEFQLMKFMIANRGRLISRDELLKEVWGYEENPTTRTIDTHIGWLRQKLEDNPKTPKLIVTVHGYGYKFSE